MKCWGRARLTICAATLAAGSSAYAQLPAPNAAGVTTGHAHLIVPDVSRHREIWRLLGAEVETSGPLELLRFPGVYVLLTEGEPTVPSTNTSANHIAFSVADYELYKANLESVDADLAFDDAAGGQILADLPDGVRVEILVDPRQHVPIAFHHFHLVADDPEAVRDWYVEVLGADAAESGPSLSALIPGGRVDVLATGGGERLSTRSSALDHIGFEVADMDAFAARLERLGVGFDAPPRTIDGTGLTVAFLTDPVGTYIEITSGLGPDD